tara:strand:+ start:23577 stop:23777 length:201 start_codon:yes stop_codon:yes gene_type:complete
MNNNININYYDLFIDEVNNSIQSGNITYILNAIKNYESFISVYYITWANNIIQTLIEENMENISIN